MIKLFIVALTLFLCVSANYEYCEVFKEDTKLFFTHNERKNINLDEFFKGYNLEYAFPNSKPLSSAGKATIRNPITQIDSFKFDFLSQSKYYLN